jgi:hypothetical protein
MSAFPTYPEAHRAAVALARQCSRDAGIERAREFNRTVYHISLLPAPQHCHGHELRMERVRPTDPLTL